MENSPADMHLIQIGKNGVTDSLISEIRKQLRKKKSDKVKILKSALGEVDKKEIASDVANRSGGILVDVRGNTFVLKRK